MENVKRDEMMGVSKGIVDTHAHLSDQMFEGEEESIIQHARECGVEFVISSGYNLHSIKRELALAEKFNNVFCTIGIYPECVDEFDEETENMLAEYAKNPKVVGIGEIGLQYTEGMPDKEKQKEVFAKQIRLAHKLKLPIVIHCRDAYGDTLNVLKENKEYLTYGGTLHCYSGSKEMADEFLKLGLHISVGGVSTFKNADKLRGVIATVPLDKIILETDCPYLAPHPFRGKRNEPALVPYTADNLAKIKGKTVDEICIITTENARRLFKI